MSLLSQSDFAITLDNVGKKFTSKEGDVIALRSTSASIIRGKITGLVGPDGAGKTTLMRLMAGLLTLTDGTITVENLNPQDPATAVKSILGYMPQKFGLYEDLTVIENMNLYADLRGVLADTRVAEFEDLLKFTDLKRFVDRPAGKLSGGMKQKLGLSCALLGKPKILLLDEPSVGVDPVSRRELWKIVNALVEKGMTVIWSTSYLDEAERCHEVLLMNEGVLVYSGTPQALTQKMEGRSIEVQHIEGNHRLVLQRALRSKEVIDGVIQGKNVRLVLREKNKKPILEILDAGPNAILTLVRPRFEDAFIDILGGGPGGDSVLSAVMKPVELLASASAVIEAVSLTKMFGDFAAADDISFKVKKGEIFGLLGPNGAGKSTTFKMMCGLLTPTLGVAKVLGIDLHESASEARQQLGYMAQKFSLYGDLSVQQNLQFFSGIYGLRGEIQATKIAEMVDAFDLKQYLVVKTNDIPLGFKQRLALACAIMHEPAILFLDEPTSGVDPITRREFWTHINGLVEKGVTVMVTTHFMEEAEYCDRVGLVYRGKFIAAGTPDELKDLVITKDLPEPTMEDAFVNLIIKNDKENKRDVMEGELAAPVGLRKSNTINNYIAAHAPLRRTVALCMKEFYQIVRDPSSIMIAFVLPIVMLFIFGYGINLDSSKIHMGVVLKDLNPEARRFENAFFNSPFISAEHFNNTADAEKKLIVGKIRGFVVIQSDFSKRLAAPNQIAPIEIITDGSEPNTANFVTSYATGAWQVWQRLRYDEGSGAENSNLIEVQPRYWFNSAAISRFFIVPGSISIIMTVIGALLTSLVVAREWERGTMEALLSTSITRLEFLISKLVPYYVLGVFSMTICTVLAITILGVPFRGSLFLLFILTSLFLGSALGLGLLLSTAIRNQFNAAQASLNIAFLPAMMLSGFVYEISTMPIAVQAFSYLISARYFVETLQTLFLAGNIGLLLFKDALFLFGSALLFLGFTYKLTRSRLD